MWTSPPLMLRIVCDHLVVYFSISFVILFNLCISLYSNCLSIIHFVFKVGAGSLIVKNIQDKLIYDGHRQRPCRRALCMPTDKAALYCMFRYNAHLRKRRPYSPPVFGRGVSRFREESKDAYSPPVFGRGVFFMAHCRKLSRKNYEIR